jgi:tRNA modification GTPase
MEFIHQHYQPGETVAAIATPIGEGGVGIIRISGKDALVVAQNVYTGPVASYKTHTAHFGHIIDAAGNIVDDVLLLVMLGKRSYTGEDTVEIHCHGGSLITRRVLDTVLAAGARAAMPGEFTFKAFINGKLDLAQAEAVQELICAKNEHALDAAKNQLQGNLSQKINRFKTDLTSIAAILEAWVDFPEEGLEFATLDEVCDDLESICQQMEKLNNTFHDGKILHDGISLCLVGSPNVGKSSLMNALLDRDRAIVSPIPGTTRDILEDHLRLNGLNFRLMDTAGIRDADEMIEQEGIRRTKSAMNEADLILLVLDAHKGIDEHDKKLIQSVPQHKTVAVWNKIDIASLEVPDITIPFVVPISAKSRTGLDDLRKTIDQVVWKNGPPSKEEVMITNVRHKESLSLAIQSCRSIINGLRNDVSPEFLSIDMRHSLNELGKVIGTNITEDILSAIFSKFCIGK